MIHNCEEATHINIAPIVHDRLKIGLRPKEQVVGLSHESESLPVSIWILGVVDQHTALAHHALGLAGERVTSHRSGLDPMLRRLDEGGVHTKACSVRNGDRVLGNRLVESNSTLGSCASA